MIGKMKIHSIKINKIKTPVKSTVYISGDNLVENLHNIAELDLAGYGKFLILSDKNVYSVYGKKLINSLNKLGKELIISIINPGEKSKTLNLIPSVIAPFFAKGFGRNACMISLGGGVVTDIGGFLSSVLLRGIHSVHIPTSLLGQVDAAIGGKSGVDFWYESSMYKNMIGKIEQPDAVITDISTLFSLPSPEIINGLGEILKYWVAFGIPDIKKIENFIHEEMLPLVAGFVNNRRLAVATIEI